MSYVGKTLAFAKVDGILVIVHGSVAADEGEWNECLAVHQLRDIVGLVVATDPRFPGLSAKERKSAADAWERRGGFVPSAVITRNPIHRGVVTALNWFGRGTMKAFSPDELQQAFTHVGVKTESARGRIVEAIAEMGASLGCSGLFSDKEARTG